MLTYCAPLYPPHTQHLRFKIGRSSGVAVGHRYGVYWQTHSGHYCHHHFHSFIYIFFPMSPLMCTFLIEGVLDLQLIGAPETYDRPLSRHCRPLWGTMVGILNFETSMALHAVNNFPGTTRLVSSVVVIQICYIILKQIQDNLCSIEV